MKNRRTKIIFSYPLPSKICFFIRFSKLMANTKELINFIHLSHSSFLQFSKNSISLLTLVMLIQLTKNYLKLTTSPILSPISTHKMQRFPIQTYQVGERLDRYLKKSPLGWTSGQKLLRKKDIVVEKKNGELVSEGDYRLQEGDTLLVCNILKQKFGKKQPQQQRSVPREEAARILSSFMIYDNQNIAVINKPPGFSVQGGLNPKTNLFSLMSSKYKKQLIHVTHRLDRGTTGLVIFAKNKQNAQFVQMAMEEKNMFSKYYLALTQGKQPLEKYAYIRGNIEWTNKNKARLCSETEQNSKDCTTFYTPLNCQQIKVKDQEFYRNLLGIKLLTGRKHQIRCHLSDYLDQPILNDAKYGGFKQDFEDEEQNTHIFLHAFGIEITKREIVDKVKIDKGCYINQRKGSVKLMANSVIFTANLPQYWPDFAKNQLQLESLVGIVKKKQKQLQSSAPKKRKIITIS